MDTERLTSFIASNLSVKVIIGLLMIVTTPFVSFSAELIHTIQIGSHRTEPRAQRQYAAVLEILKEQERADLRIERIGKYYALRLGRFATIAEAEDLLTIVAAISADAEIMTAYISQNKLIKIYQTRAVEILAATMRAQPPALVADGEADTAKSQIDVAAPIADPLGQPAEPLTSVAVDRAETLSAQKEGAAPGFLEISAAPFQIVAGDKGELPVNSTVPQADHLESSAEPVTIVDVGMLKVLPLQNEAGTPGLGESPASPSAKAETNQPEPQVELTVSVAEVNTAATPPAKNLVPAADSVLKVEQASVVPEEQQANVTVPGGRLPEVESQVTAPIKPSQDPQPAGQVAVTAPTLSSRQLIILATAVVLVLLVLVVRAGKSKQKKPASRASQPGNAVVESGALSAESAEQTQRVTAPQVESLNPAALATGTDQLVASSQGETETHRVQSEFPCAEQTDEQSESLISVMRGFRDDGSLHSTAVVAGRPEVESKQGEETAVDPSESEHAAVAPQDDAATVLSAADILAKKEIVSQPEEKQNRVSRALEAAMRASGGKS